MTRINFRKSILVAGLLISAGLTLSACQTTGTSGSGTSANLDRIDSVLARATNDAMSRGKLNESVELLENMYKRNSSNPAITVRYAKALRYVGRYQRAALVLGPFAKNYEEHKNTDVLIEYSALQSAIGNYSIAEEYARKALVDKPDNARAQHVLGIALDAQSHHKEAEIAFRKALENWEGDPSTLLNNLGLNLAAQGQVTEAISILERAANAAPERIEIERNLRIVSALQNKSYTPAAEAVPIPVPSVKPKKTDIQKADPGTATPNEDTEDMSGDNAKDTEESVAEQSQEEAPKPKKQRSFN